MNSSSPPLATRRWAEIAVALATGLVGGTVMAGALEFGIGWGDAGPEPGAFPFYVGLVIVAASLVNIAAGLLAEEGGKPFLDRQQARRVAAFFLPIVAFVGLAVLLGLYVASVLYLVFSMVFQGGYRLAPAIAVALGTAAFFYLVLEIWFRVPLLKGPLEAALGIY